MTTASGTADALLSGLIPVTALGAGLSAGVFLAFSGFVMAGLARTPDPVGVRAMQEINRAAPSPVFMLVLFGTGALAVVVTVIGFVRAAPTAPLVLVATLAHAVCLGLTIAYHVPRNDDLARLDPDAAGTAALWRDYVRGWTALNHLRTLTAAAGCLLLIIAHGVQQR